MLASKVLGSFSRCVAVLVVLVLSGCSVRPGEGGTERVGAASQALESDPDLVIHDVVAPPSAVPGASFPVLVTVCNDGASTSSHSSIEIRLSDDDDVTTSDPPAGDSVLSPLEPGACADVEMTGYAYLPDGAYRVGIIADPYDYLPEADETNNIGAGDVLAIGWGPDLIVSAAQSPTSVPPWELLRASVTVCNQGTDWSYGSSVIVLLSEDDEITLSDAYVGEAWLSQIDPGQCADVTVEGGVSVPDGVYHLGAIADPNDYVFELVEGNNAGAAHELAVGWAPDLVVSAVTGPPSALQGSMLEAEVLVCNLGTAHAYSAEVHAWLSDDDEITEDDEPIGSGWISMIETGECAEVNIAWGVFVPDGVYRLGATVAEVYGPTEILDGNNATAGNLVGVGWGPDLVVTAVSGPPSMIPGGGGFDVSATVCNRGTTPAWGAQVEARLSSDDAITASDTPIGGFWIGELDVGQCADVTIPALYYGPEGLRYLGVLADAYDFVPELIETNNGAAGDRLAIGWGPDLVVTGVSGPPSTVSFGFDAAVTVCNQGTEMSYGAQLEVRLSADDAITSSDPPVGGTPLPSLAPGACADLDVYTNGWFPEGAYHLGARVALDYGQDLNEFNNTNAGTLIGVGWQPDLVVASISGPPSAMPWSPFDLSVTVCNQGSVPSWGSSSVDLRLSTNTTITSSDPFIGSAYVGYLEAGQCVETTVPANAPMEGVYHVGAAVDRYHYVIETIETNNVTVGGVIGVGWHADLIVSEVNGPPSAAPWSTGDVLVTVCNQGQSPSWGADVQVRLSSDASISPDDELVGYAWMNTVDPGQCATATVQADFGGPQGAYRLGAIVNQNAVVPELIHSNNTLVDGWIGIGMNPDFVVAGVSGPPSLIPGEPFEVDVTLCNQGTTPGFTNVGVMLSSDPDITELDPIVAWNHASLDAGQCVELALTAYATVPPGAYYLGALADLYNGVEELLEGNNANPGSLVGAGWEPDLIVSAVSAPPSATPGNPFPVGITVCNQGTTPSWSTDVELRLSSDTTITPSDPLSGSAPVPPLNAGECVEIAMTGAWYVPEGVYHAGAVVDSWNGVSELLEQNNTAASAMVGIGWKPDLAITDVSGPPSASPGIPFMASVTVCNQGTFASWGSGVDVFLSTDAVITPSDPILGGAGLGVLDPGQCEALSIPVEAYVPLGAYHLGAVADPYNGVDELIEANNAAAGNEIEVSF